MIPCCSYYRGLINEAYTVYIYYPRLIEPSVNWALRCIGPNYQSGVDCSYVIIDKSVVVFNWSSFDELARFSVTELFISF